MSTWNFMRKSERDYTFMQSEALGFALRFYTENSAGTVFFRKIPACIGIDYY